MMKDFRTDLGLLAFAVLLITLFSASSPLYPFNPWDDAQVFMTMGKSMLKGKLLYTELQDQKGPMLSMVHEWAAFVSERSFLGIYLLEVLCAFGFLACAYRLMRLFADARTSRWCTCIVGVLTYTSDFMFFGDSVEELALPALLFVLYKGLCYARQDRLPSPLEATAIGAGLAMLFWMKFMVLVMCAGALSAFAIIAWKRRQLPALGRCLLWAVGGCAFVTAGVFAYFLAHGNIGDLFYSYFYFNVTLNLQSHDVGSVTAWWFMPAKLAGWLLLVGMLWPIRASKDVKLMVMACWGAELTTFVLFKVYIYYFLIVFVFAPLSIYYLRRVQPKRVLCVLAVCVTLLGTLTNFNLMTLLSGRFPQAVQPMAELINADQDPDKQVLCTKSYETGIYILTDCLPPIAHFFTMNVYVPDYIETHRAYLASGKAKYVIRKSDGSGNETGHYKDFVPDLSNYELVMESYTDYRTEFILHPLQYLWTLGYTQPLMRRFYTPDDRNVHWMLYRRRSTAAL